MATGGKWTRIRSKGPVPGSGRFDKKVVSVRVKNLKNQAAEADALDQVNFDVRSKEISDLEAMGFPDVNSSIIRESRKKLRSDIRMVRNMTQVARAINEMSGGPELRPNNPDIAKDLDRRTEEEHARLANRERRNRLEKELVRKVARQEKLRSAKPEPTKKYKLYRGK